MTRCHDVRYKVFSDEQGYDRAIEVDDIDPECLHWVAIDQDGKGLGTARMYLYSPTIGKIGRVAVLSTSRGTGLGKMLMESIEQYVLDKTEIQTLKLSSQVPRQGFYAKLGYIAEGDIYPDEGQPHITMSKTLTRINAPQQ
ncbi:hypothetical protein BGW38_004764 [Lunasporangiospora selenospora]|uniref:N-acetyltransferase domain-containing protein n=1 Tax=Lunasporangiospora selenospora TaxID=979761 RepID=A0A9P6G255_9FUNG|nr:hypothetical protein BGW38_004764 [Lunasporangiospora selenospora]